MRGEEAKVIQSVMRPSSITLTLDTYGHLIAGAEATAVTANADLTAVPDIIVQADATSADLAATGTDSANQTCIPFVSQQDGKRRIVGERLRKESDAKPCNETKSQSPKTLQKTVRNDAKRSTANHREPP